MKYIKKVFSLLLIFVLFASLVGCKPKETTSTLSTSPLNIIHEPEFGGVYITMTIEEFNELGFEYGDSVNLYFSNDYKVEDLPYYSGYYTRNNEELLVAYPGYAFIKYAINNGADAWDVAKVSEDDTCTIELNERGKYINIQNARNIFYYDDRNLYNSDEIFANFRALRGGNLKDNYLFRSASPCDNQHNRASYVDTLIKNAQIKHIINLADTDDKIKGYLSKEDYNSPYFLTLFKPDDVDNDSVDALAFNMNFESDYFKEQVVKAMMAIINNDGPFLIHCTEGKDRTGFICMLLEALADASIDEAQEDYMMTYFNYYAITKAFDRTRYLTIVDNVFIPLVEALVEDKTMNVRIYKLQDLAIAYLVRLGMSEDDINTLITKISK